MRTIVYVRVSSVEQSKGLSLASQRTTCIEACSARGWDVVDIASDSASGKSIRRRPGLARAIERLEAGEAEALVVSRLDRLSRSALDFYDLMSRADKRGWVLCCLSPSFDMSDPGGRMVAGVAAVFAQFERELISQRQRESVAARRAAGTYKPPQPACSDEATARILRLRGQGFSPEKIAARLEMEGFVPPRARVWHPRTVRKVIARVSAAGA